MPASHVVAAVVFAVMALPAFGVARMLARGRAPGSAMPDTASARRRRSLDRTLGRLMGCAGIAIGMTAPALLWAGGDAARTTLVVVVMAVVVNAFAIAMAIAVVSAKRHAGMDG